MRDAVLRWTPLVTLLALVVGGGVAGLTAFEPEAVAAAGAACARGYEPVDDALKEVRSEMRTEMPPSKPVRQAPSTRATRARAASTSPSSSARRSVRSPSSRAPTPARGTPCASSLVVRSR